MQAKKFLTSGPAGGEPFSAFSYSIVTRSKPHPSPVELKGGQMGAESGLWFCQLIGRIRISTCPTPAICLRSMQQRPQKNAPGLLVSWGGSLKTGFQGEEKNSLPLPQKVLFCFLLPVDKLLPYLLPSQLANIDKLFLPCICFQGLSLFALAARSPFFAFLFTFSLFLFCFQTRQAFRSQARSPIIWIRWMNAGGVPLFQIIRQDCVVKAHYMPVQGSVDTIQQQPSP